MSTQVRPNLRAPLSQEPAGEIPTPLKGPRMGLFRPPKKTSGSSQRDTLHQTRTVDGQARTPDRQRFSPDTPGPTSARSVKRPNVVDSAIAGSGSRTTVIDPELVMLRKVQLINCIVPTRPGPRSGFFASTASPNLPSEVDTVLLRPSNGLSKRDSSVPTLEKDDLKESETEEPLTPQLENRPVLFRGPSQPQQLPFLRCSTTTAATSTPVTATATVVTAVATAITETPEPKTPHRGFTPINGDGDRSIIFKSDKSSSLDSASPKTKTGRTPLPNGRRSRHRTASRSIVYDAVFEPLEKAAEEERKRAIKRQRDAVRATNREAKKRKTAAPAGPRKRPKKNPEGENDVNLSGRCRSTN